MMTMSDQELSALDPLIMNLVVAKGIPECAALDISAHARTVDEWARLVGAATRRAEPHAHGEALYQHDPDLWRAGGMAIMLAGPAFGVRYTGDKLNPARPEQSFVHDVIDGRTGTCASMPVLYMAMGFRLGWPIRGVVSKDHMWARWDDGVSVERGGKRFNLEATTATSDGQFGTFASTTDEEYAKDLRTPPIAIRSGSDMTTLTARETLGVFLQERAGYWEAKGDWARAEADLLLATACFPKNRDIRAFLLTAMSRTNRTYFAAPEIDQLAAIVGGGASWDARATKARRPMPRLSPEEVSRINRENTSNAARAASPDSP